jgi:hypothetical protein
MSDLEDGEIEGELGPGEIESSWAQLLASTATATASMLRHSGPHNVLCLAAVPQPPSPPKEQLDDFTQRAQHAQSPPAEPRERLLAPRAANGRSAAALALSCVLLCTAACFFTAFIQASEYFSWLVNDWTSLGAGRHTMPNRTRMGSEGVAAAARRRKRRLRRPALWMCTARG